MIRKTDHFFNLQSEKKLPYEALYRINVGQNLEEEVAYQSLKEIFEIPQKEVRTSLLSSLLSGVMVKRADIEEVVGLLKAALSLDGNVWKKKIKITLPRGAKLIGYAGSGKKGFKTMNVSTPASLLAAGCGVYVAKACSYATSSMTGASDLLTELGVKIDLSLSDNIGVSFRSAVPDLSGLSAAYRWQYPSGTASLYVGCL